MNKLKVVCNRFIPFPGFSSMQLFGIIFRRQEYCGMQISKRTYNHELIHLYQALDFVWGCKKLQFLGFIFFYIWYLIEWLIKLIVSIFTLGYIKAYCSISFEIDAYENELDYTYCETRKKFSWIKNVFKIRK